MPASARELADLVEAVVARGGRVGALLGHPVGGVAQPRQPAAQGGGERDAEQEGDGEPDGSRGQERLAHLVEGGFKLVSEGSDLVEAEHGPRPLDGVKGAKGGIDQFPLFGALPEIEQGFFQHFKEFACLLTKYFRRVRRANDRTSFATTASNCSGLNGLVIHPVAPALLASCLSASLDSVVRNTMGRPVSDGCLRSARISSRPFI